MQKSALITGITGQDGSYLAELLLDKGYRVHGMVRRSSSFSTGRIDHLYRDVHEQPQLLLHYGDLTDGQALTNLVLDVQPDEIYNLGAQSHVRVSFDQPVYTLMSDGVGALNVWRLPGCSISRSKSKCIRRAVVKCLEWCSRHRRRRRPLSIRKVPMRARSAMPFIRPSITDEVTVCSHAMEFFSIMNRRVEAKRS